MKIFMGTVLTILVLGSQSATAGDKTEEVQFKKGATSATISGNIKGEHALTYKLKANAGQVMSILFAPKNASCYFNVIPPGSDEAIHIGSTSGNEFAGTLGVGGEYKTQVYLMRNAARRNETCNYSITFEISAASGATPTGPPGSEELPMQKACAAQAVSMYGVPLPEVRFKDEGNVVATIDGFSIKGEVDKGAEGKKQFNCLFAKDRSLKTLMPLNSDGE
jgi:hypothetical protein